MNRRNLESTAALRYNARQSSLPLDQFDGRFARSVFFEAYSARFHTIDAVKRLDHICDDRKTRGACRHDSCSRLLRVQIMGFEHWFATTFKCGEPAAGPAISLTRLPRQWELGCAWAASPSSDVPYFAKVSAGILRKSDYFVRL